MGPCVRRDDVLIEFARWVPAFAGRRKRQPPAFSLASVTLKRRSSASEEETVGTCSPSEAREIATRVLLKTLSTPPPSGLRLLSSSDISTEWVPSESSATLPGVAEVRISALSGALIGARPWE